MEKTLTSQSRQSTLSPMLIIGTLFFVFGFVTWLNGALIPFLQIVCELNEFQALLVTFAFYIAYTVMALPMSFLLNVLGYKKGMLAGLLIMAVGALLFIPAAQSAWYPLFLLALFTLGTGLTILQTATNPYIVCIGPHESAAMRISIMGLVNKAAGIIVPVVFAALVLSDIEQFSADALALLTAAERQVQLAELSARLVLPYVYMTGALLLLAVFIWFAPLPELPQEEGVDAKGKGYIKAAFAYPQLVLGVVALFCYVGVEVIAGDTIGLYGSQLGVAHFGILTSYTMSFMVLGYILGVLLIPRYLSQSLALKLSAIFGLLFSFGVLFSSTNSQQLSLWVFGWMGIPVVPDTVFFVALLGLANALVWPAVWPLALAGLGKLTATGSAMLIMGIAGGALLPLTYGYLAETSGNSQGAYWILLPCYLFILFYAFKGHKLTAWSRK
ncbi:glucose/galactose MFS transporter [Alishewanella longhuensis]|uniref:Glucose/galactose MFS transporter n=1 Tax=Alishewanella longhuensis TaxID=1091037 RepID=A0ABQ3KWS4_9ALTE|nr:sugar MFS transporter [Alishewanella longhuensis]GHG62803.1 glucose/galactose MFS transporter [Alishewanella longhuensis]